LKSELFNNSSYLALYPFILLVSLSMVFLGIGGLLISPGFANRDISAAANTPM